VETDIDRIGRRSKNQMGKVYKEELKIMKIGLNGRKKLR
jgi:hypothetical protein